MKLVLGQTEIKPDGTYIKDFSVCAKTEKQLDLFLRAFEDLLKLEEPWTIGSVKPSYCGDHDENGFYTWVFVEAHKFDIVEMTADFKRLYKAAKIASCSK
tara:strand:- start:429 stop:728 length:300 start_codon:yes stop_codon:yes gene_type:complete